jgi:hypothetical protein
MTITLEAIEAEQSKLTADHARINSLIDAFRNQARATEITIPAVTIPLATGECLAGAILNDDGAVSHYVILLPGQVEDVNWSDAKEWAENCGGELPTRREQALLYANLKDEFDERWYWSGEAHEDESGWAWRQDFHHGYQDGNLQSHELRARAVRRFIPSVI